VVAVERTERYHGQLPPLPPPPLLVQYWYGYYYM